MLDVHRRVEAARVNAVLSLVVAVVTSAVIVASGVDVNATGLVCSIAGAIGGGLLSAATIKVRTGGDGVGRLAAIHETRARALRQDATLWACTLAGLITLCAFWGQWWLIIVACITTAVVEVLEWCRVVRWERQHPGAVLVTNLAPWGPKRFILHTAPPPHAAAGA